MAWNSYSSGLRMHRLVLVSATIKYGYAATRQSRDTTKPTEWVCAQQRLRSNKCKSAYIENIERILNSCGFSGIWQSHDVINPRWLSLAIKQKLRDQYLQNWHSLVEMSSSGKNYKLFKEEFEQSKYFRYLPSRYCKTLTRVRTRNTKLPVEIGRWNGTPLGERTCTLSGHGWVPKTGWHCDVCKTLSTL